MKYFRRNIIYTKCPLKGAFKYCDRFILQPINKTNIPYSPYAKHYPVFLDFCFEDVDGLDEFYLIQKDIDLSRKYCHILTALSNFEFFTYDSAATIWGIAAPSVLYDEMTLEEKGAYEESAKKSKWIFVPCYKYPEYAQERIINSLSILDGNDDIVFDNNPSYFTENPIQEEKEQVVFQKGIIDALDTYFILDDEAREKVDSAIVLISDGIRLGLRHQSLGFVSFISSIETMIDLENKGLKVEHCKTCGQPIYGVNKKFLNYLSKYVSRAQVSINKFKRLYTLRSKIAHSGKLFLNDKEFSLLNKETTDKEWYTYLEAQQLARLSLFRWLLLNKNR